MRLNGFTGFLCGFAIVVVAALLATFAVILARPTLAATAPVGARGDLYRRINHVRVERGLAPLYYGGIITAVAQQQAEDMAAVNRLYHNPYLTLRVPNWTFVGENVGVGPDWLTIHRAFMQSVGHRANILDRDFTRVGVGIAHGDRTWVSVVFKTAPGDLK